jgi:hypothetical protein
VTRSARPVWPAPVTTSAANHASRSASTTTAAAQTAGRNPHGTPRTAPPRPSRPDGERGEAGRRRDRVQRGTTADVLRERRNQHPGRGPRHQDQPPGRVGRAEGEPRGDVTDADHKEGQRHHPTIDRAHGGQRADRIGHRVERRRLQARRHHPPGDQQHRRRDRRDQTPPRYAPHDHHGRQGLPSQVVAKVPPGRPYRWAESPQEAKSPPGKDYQFIDPPHVGRHDHPRKYYVT